MALENQSPGAANRPMKYGRAFSAKRVGGNVTAPACGRTISWNCFFQVAKDF
jgi:hypothetical protein